MRLPPDASAMSAAPGGAAMGAELESDVTVSRAAGMRLVVARLVVAVWRCGSEEGPRRRVGGGSRRLPSSSATSVAATCPARDVFTMLAPELLVPTAAPTSAALLLESGRLLKLNPSATATAGPSLGCNAEAAEAAAGVAKRLGGNSDGCIPTSMAGGRLELRRAGGAGRRSGTLLRDSPAASRRRGAMVALPGELMRAMPLLAPDSAAAVADDV